MRRFGGGSIALAAAIVATLGAATGASAAAPCTTPAAGGDWPMYGHDLANSRSQPDEHTIGVANVANLKPAWVFSTKTAGDPGAFETTPVVSEGCAYIGSTSGVLYAVDMTDGRLVWRRQLAVPSPGLGGAIVGAAAVDGDELIVLADESGGPYAEAFQRSTGAVLWKSAPFVSLGGVLHEREPGRGRRARRGRLVAS